MVFVVTFVIAKHDLFAVFEPFFFFVQEVKKMYLANIFCTLKAQILKFLLILSTKQFPKWKQAQSFIFRCVSI